MFCCGNWFRNQKQGNHQNLGSTKRKLSRKNVPSHPVLTILNSRSLGKGISVGRPGSDPSPARVDQTRWHSLQNPNTWFKEWAPPRMRSSWVHSLTGTSANNVFIETSRQKLRVAQTWLTKSSLPSHSVYNNLKDKVQTSGWMALNTGMSINVIWLCNKRESALEYTGNQRYLWIYTE